MSAEGRCGLCGQDGLHFCVERERMEARYDQGREFWERVYVAVIEVAHKQAHPEVPWSERNAEIADTALQRWRERFNPNLEEKS